MKLLIEGKYMKLINITLNKVAHILISKIVQYLSDADSSFEFWFNSWIWFMFLCWGECLGLGEGFIVDITTLLEMCIEN